MINKPCFVFLFCIAIFGLYSCATTTNLPQQESDNAKNIITPSGKSIIYVYRISNYGYAVGLSVRCNNTDIETFFPKRFYLCVLDPGKYVFTYSGENEDDVILIAEPNKKYYIQVRAQTGWAAARCKLELTDLEKGSSDILKCKLVGMNEAAKACLIK